MCESEAGLGLDGVSGAESKGEVEGVHGMLSGFSEQRAMQ